LVDFEKKLQQGILMEKKEQVILSGSGLRLGYQSGKKTTEVASDISFELKKGELTCLLGPNGVGKSTLLKAIMGQNPPLEGELLFQGHPLSSFNQKELAKKIAVVLTEKITTANLTVGQLVALGRTPHTGWLGNLSDADKSIVEFLPAHWNVHTRSVQVDERCRNEILFAAFNHRCETAVHSRQHRGRLT
jgi:ABC-type cobalamin/Fe3+-siderophores transport system ATPase subunit